MSIDPSQPANSWRSRAIALGDTLGQRLSAGRDRRIGVAVLIAALILVTAALAPIASDAGPLNVGLIYLLLTLVVTAIWGLPVGLLSAVLCNLAMNFFFVEPLHQFNVKELRNAAGLLLFLLVSILGGLLVSSTRRAAQEAKRREAETAVLLDMSRTMIGRTEPAEALASLCAQAVASLAAPGAAVLAISGRAWPVLASAGSPDAGREPDGDERAVAEYAVSKNTLVLTGMRANRRRRHRILAPFAAEQAKTGRTAVFVPLRVGHRPLGVLRVDGPLGDSPFRSQPERLLVAFAREAALAVERLELAREAAHTQALREADEMKTALMASISHDLNTPLAGIKASVSSLLEPGIAWSDDDRRAFLETIDSQADRLSKVISDILNLNRIEAGAVAPIKQTVPVLQLLEDARVRTKPVTSGRNVVVQAPGDLSVNTDESLIGQAIVNLIENASKYSTPGGSITIAGERVGNDVILSVADEGPGIPPADLPHVFDRFYRAGEQSRRVKGSGLGLAIVKAFAGLCGGAVSVSSSEAGTRFVITLPGDMP